MNKFILDGYQEMQDDGHCIFYGDGALDFGDGLPLSYEKWFSFHCPVSSTSFMFRITFQIEADGDGVECIVLIRRTDDMPIRVDIDFWMNAITTASNVRVTPRLIRLVGMPRFAQTTQLVEAFLPNDILRYILLEVNMSVRGCHNGSESSSGRRLSPGLPD